MTNLRTAAQQALEALHSVEWHGGASAWMLNDCKVEAAIVALRAALAEPPVDDPHRDHWVAIAEAAQKIAASKECGLMEAKALCAALDRLTDAALAEQRLTDMEQKMERSIKSLKAALAEPVQEPVAWKDKIYETLYHQNFGNSIPLYAAPPQRKPLTEEEIYSLFRAVASPVMFARAIEREHGIT